MNNYEIIKECKQAYEILNDLVDNCDLINTDERESLVSSMDLLADIYTNAWEEMYNGEEKKELETNIIDRHGHKVIISDLIGYAYLCEECDENNYTMECEVDKKKYSYEDFDTLEQARNQLANYVCYKDSLLNEYKDSLLNEIDEELENKNENIELCNKLIEEVVNTLNNIIAKNTDLCWWK